MKKLLLALGLVVLSAVNTVKAADIYQYTYTDTNYYTCKVYYSTYTGMYWQSCYFNYYLWKLYN